MTTELAAVTVPSSSSKSEEESRDYRLSRFDEASSSAYDVYAVCPYPIHERSNGYHVNSSKDSEKLKLAVPDICLTINSRFVLFEYR